MLFKYILFMYNMYIIFNEGYLIEYPDNHV